MAKDPTILDKNFSFLTSTHSFTIHYTTFGNPDSPTLIFVHGTPWSSRLFKPLALSLSHHFHITLFDNPGFGASPPGQPLSSTSSPSPELASDFNSLIQSFHHLLTHLQSIFPAAHPNPHIIAHDIGGLIALYTLLLPHHHQYASLLLLDPVATLPFGSPFYRLVATTPATFTQIPEAVFQGLLESYIRGAAFKPLSRDWLDTLTSPWLSDARNGAQGIEGFVRQIAQADAVVVQQVEESLGRIKDNCDGGRVRIMWGRDDTWIPVERAWKLARLIGLDERDVIVVDEAGHLLMCDQPERVGVEVGWWLRGLTSGQGGS